MLVIVKEGVVPPIVQTILQLLPNIPDACACVFVVVVPATTVNEGNIDIPKLPVAVKDAVVAFGISCHVVPPSGDV